MTREESQRYEFESIMRARLKPIAKHNNPKQAKQPEGASA